MNELESHWQPGRRRFSEQGPRDLWGSSLSHSKVPRGVALGTSHHHWMNPIYRDTHIHTHKQSTKKQTEKLNGLELGKLCAWSKGMIWETLISQLPSLCLQSSDWSRPGSGPGPLSSVQPGSHTATLDQTFRLSFRKLFCILIVFKQRVYFHCKNSIRLNSRVTFLHRRSLFRWRKGCSDGKQNREGSSRNTN